MHTSRSVCTRSVLWDDGSVATISMELSCFIIHARPMLNLLSGIWTVRGSPLLDAEDARVVRTDGGARHHVKRPPQPRAVACDVVHNRGRQRPPQAV